nr:hypothetical protein [Kibdelosporangium sp. MJ126-NF4]CEL21617.1 hypothetical protein [Kibdelosporangium sp. MJ126-NF4]CTQ92398.1 hypothetical protein [Kibdelosporangium sp. MJ126-NF4]
MAPLVVFVASLSQFLLAATFVIIPVVGGLFGTSAQHAAEAEVVRQGLPATLLAERRINFGASRVSIAIAIAIGLCLATLASLNLAGNGTGQILSWIIQSIILVLGCVIMPGEVFVARFIESGFAKSGDQALRRVDVRAFVDAAANTFPAWFRHVIAARFALATVGSLLVIILLTFPAANAYFG